MSEPELVLPFIIDTDTINEQFGASDIECLRCGKCCKIPNTDRYCKHLEIKVPKVPLSRCTIYGSRNGRLIDETPEGKIYCYPRMYEMSTIPGCAYQPQIDYIKGLIKNGSEHVRRNR